MSDEPGPLLAAGRAADVYDLGDGTVLRRYRRPDGHDTDLEAEVMRHVRRHGYPVPEVHRADGPDLVMDRVDGETMLVALGRSPWKLRRYARLLAELQRRLAKIPAPDWLFAAGVAPIDEDSVIHLDLHPMNVILSPERGPTVIDWTNAAAGPPGFDAALTYVVMRTYRPAARRDRIAQRIFVESFRRARGAALLAPYLGPACDHRLADPGTEPDERAAVAALRSRLAHAR